MKYWPRRKFVNISRVLGKKAGPEECLGSRKVVLIKVEANREGGKRVMEEKEEEEEEEEEEGNGEGEGEERKEGKRKKNRLVFISRAISTCFYIYVLLYTF